MPPETLDSLDETLKPMVLRIVAQNAALLGRIDELLEQNKALLDRIAKLEAKLEIPPKTPDNSSVRAPRRATGPIGPRGPRSRARAGLGRHARCARTPTPCATSMPRSAASAVGP